MPRTPTPGTAHRRWFVPYGQAIGLMLAALALRLLILPVEPRLAYLTFYPATAALYYCCGRAAGHLSVVLGALLGLTLFASPGDGGALVAEDAWAAALYVAYSLFVGGLIERLRATLQDQTEITARLNDLYDNAPCGYHSLDARGKYVNLNRVALSWLGCSREEVIGLLGPTDFFTEEGRAQFRENYPRFLRDGRVGPLDFDLVSRDGSVRRVSTTATAIRDAEGRFLMSRSVMYDITALHQAQRRLDQLNREQLAMLDNDIVGIVRLRDRRIAWNNKALGRMFGYGSDELLGQPSRLLYPDDESHRALGEIAYPILRQDKHFRTQLQMRRKNGELIWIDLSGAALNGDASESLWMMADITGMKLDQLRMEHIAFHDPLTGLANRLLLNDRLAQALRLAERQAQMVAVCYLDLDGFKPVNDRYGHEAGDRLLCEVAHRLQEGVRVNDTVARVGGDEFIVLLGQLDDAGEARASLNRIQERLEKPVTLGPDIEVRLSASIGVAYYPTHGLDADALMALADQALYEAKRGGRAQYRVYGQDTVTGDL